MTDVTAQQFQTDANNFADVSNGDINTTVTMRLGQNVDSVAKTINDIKLQATDEINKLALSFNLTDAGFDFATGGTLTANNQLVSDGTNSWQYQNTIPAGGFVVAPGTVPSSPTWEQRTFNEIDNISGLRSELDDRAVYLALAESQASDLREEQYVRLTDADLSAYEVVPSSDTGGVYKTNILGGKKLKSVRDGKAWSINSFSGNTDSQRLQNALEAGEPVYIPTDREYVIDEVDMPDSDTYIFGNRARIRSNAGTHALLQTHSGHKATIHGLDFYGNSVAFDFQAQGALPVVNGGYEHDIAHCKFHEAAGIPKLRLRGSREGSISFCEFRGNGGIEREFAINTQVDHCKWANCDYMVNDLLGSEGLIMVSPVCLGNSFGVYGRRSTGIQLIGSMIDYVDSPLVFEGCTDVEMMGGYISTRTTAAALDVRAYSGDGFQGYNHSYLGVKFRTNDVNGPRVVSLSDAYQVDLLKCYILNQGSNSNGIEYGNLTNSTISVTQRVRSGATNTTSIRALSGQDDATVKIRGSNINPSSPIVRDNFNEKDVSGWLTENRGEAIITTGNSSVVVTHGLSITPNKLDITLTPTTPNTQNLGYYISSTTSTTFTITLTSAVAATTAFAWKHSRF